MEATFEEGSQTLARLSQVCKAIESEVQNVPGTVHKLTLAYNLQKCQNHKVKGRLKNYSRMKGTKKIRQLNTMTDLILKGSCY